MKLYTVTLEERATSPASCAHWKTCYGNNMMSAIRYDANDALIDTMESELIELQRKHPNGFMVRSHST